MGPVSDPGFRQLEPVAGTVRDNHMVQDVLECEAGDSQPEADMQDGVLAQWRGLEEFHERRRAWEVIPPPGERCLEGGNLHADSVAPAFPACWETRLAPGQRRSAMTPVRKDSPGGTVGS